MKKLLTITLAFVALAFIASCGGDETTPEKFVINETEMNGLILNAYSIDGGSCCQGLPRAEVNSNTKYQYFELTDGSYTFDNDGFITEFVEGDLNLKIYIDTYSEGTTFEGGDFIIRNDCTYSGEINGVEIYAGWNTGVESNVNYYESSGTVNIAKNGSTYSFVFDGELIDYSVYNPPLRGEGGSCEYYGRVPVTGKFKTQFTEISEEVWNAYD